MIKLYTTTEDTLVEDTTLTFMKFPGGENHIKRDENANTLPNVAYITGANIDDYVIAALWADMCQQEGVKTTAVIPYLPAARADRGAPFGAKVYANIIDSAGFDEVICFDPHSPVMPALIKTPLTVKHSADFIKQSLETENYGGVIAPDNGAVERAQRVADALNVPLFKAEKERDFETGKLTNFTCEPVPQDTKLLVVDDICDGGYTFVGLAQNIDTDPQNIDLWVSHGVFSGNAPQLNTIYNTVHTTDSHPAGVERADMEAKVHPLLEFLIS